MGIKFIYIDDETQDSLNSFTRAVQVTGELDIDARQPSAFDSQITDLMVQLKQYDGLILDWRLDEIPLQTGERIKWRAAALAQEIRTKATERECPDMPIILWSTDEKLTRSYYGDHTGHDLFDMRYDKGYVVDESKQVGKQLLSIANAYKRLSDRQNASVHGTLGITEEYFETLDERFTAALTSSDYLAVHDIARFLLKEAIMRPGVLIDEDYLASRLGIDKDISQDWESLLGILPDHAKYSGPFSEAWPRWWASVVEVEWWRSLQKKQRHLSATNATERVAILKESCGLENLIEATPLEESYTNYFYSICQATNKPLDPNDGVLMQEKESLPWQDRRYISIEAALERIGEDRGIRPDAVEVRRLSAIVQERMEVSEGA